MPKNTKENSKDKKTTKTSKKNVVKVETKPEKTPEKKVSDVKPEVEFNRKDKVITSDSNNNFKILFIVTLCVAVVLIAALIYTIYSKRVPKLKDGDEIVATINGKTVTADDLFEALKESNGASELVNLIDEYIADKEITMSKEDEDYVDEVVDYYVDYADYYQTDLATFLANYVGLNGISNKDEFHDYIYNDYKKTLAITKFIGDQALEDDLKKYYTENYSDTLTVKHILIEVDSEAEDKDKADKEAYDKAVKLIKELNETSAKNLDSKFEKLAKENSDDTATYSNGGLKKDFTKKGTDEAFYNASLKLKDGEYTKEPVKSSSGYHIILKVSSTAVEEYDAIKDDVKKSYAESLLSEDDTLYTRKWGELREQYKLSINDDYIKKTYEDTLKKADEDSKK